MISSLSLGCLILILLIAPFRLCKIKTLAVFIFAGAALFFWIPLGSIPYEHMLLYYFLAAAIDLAVVETLSLFQNPPKFISNLILIGILFIVSDLISLVAFMADVDFTQIYNFICLTLYMSVLIMVTRNKSYVRDNKIHRRHNHNFANDSQSSVLIRTNEKEAGN